MTKARYVMIAEVIGDLTNHASNSHERLDVLHVVGYALADRFTQDNPHFQRGWFLAIAGLVDCTRCGDKLDSYGAGEEHGQTCPNTDDGRHVPSEPL